MEVEEKTLPAIDNSEENNSKKEKILTLLFPNESQQQQPQPQLGEGKESRKDKNKPQTKVVIRRLPPRYTKEAFIEEFSPLPAHDYFHFVRGDLNLGSHAFSRAYINFLNQEDIFSFKEKYDDYDLQDEKGRTYHAVVEFASFQKIPKRNAIKKKSSKAGTLESDPKYIEFLQKLEESKNFINNPSEYFHETENSSLKAKVITTPLLEFLKRKRQKKIDLRNEIRQRKREAEREKKRKEEEKRKAEREKRKEEKKNTDKGKTIEEKQEKIEERTRDKRNIKEEKKELKNRKNLEKESISEERLDTVIPNDPAILEVVVRRSDRESKSGIKTVSKSNEETKFVGKINEGDYGGKSERKYTDFRSRLAEEKQRKTFSKRDPDEGKTIKSNPDRSRKGVPDEKGDNYTVGNCGEAGKKSETDPESKRFGAEGKETKSKFRYSEQRNRDREYRQKASSDCGKTPKESIDQSIDSAEAKGKLKFPEGRSPAGKVSNPTREEVKKSISEPHVVIDGGTIVRNSALARIETESISLLSSSGNSNRSSSSSSSRRKSLDLEREKIDTERKRSKSFQGVSGRELCRFEADAADAFIGRKGEKGGESEGGRDRIGSGEDGESGRRGENPKDNLESDKMDEEEAKKDPRTGRRIRNKDRPSMEIYRPGMGKFSKQRLEQKKEETNSCASPSSPASNKSNNRFGHKSNGKKSIFPEGGKNSPRGQESGNQQKSGEGNGKSIQAESKATNFSRGESKEN